MSMTRGVLYWITGLSGAGKTTIGNYLYYSLKQQQDNVILLDGDVLKNIVSDHPTYTDEDRRSRAMKYARLCKTLTDQGLVVICCTIAMYQNVRDWNRENNRGYVEVFLDVPMDVLKARDQKNMYSAQAAGQLSDLAGVDLKVEFPQHPDLILKNDGSMSVKECVRKILDCRVQYSNNYNRDTEYWNLYYASDPDISTPSRFAQDLMRQLRRFLPDHSPDDTEPLTLLELGCGNGRDSLYFFENHIDITAIDASDKAIRDLNERYGNIDGLRFMCDDFVCSTALYQGSYDICYSRFTLHSINPEQERMVVENVFKALRRGGVFCIEVRSVHDPLYGKGKPAGRNAYSYNGHYRRFIVREELEKELTQAGFDIRFSKESTGFAPHGEEDPPIIRIIAEKKL